MKSYFSCGTKANLQAGLLNSWVKVFRIIPLFRILRLTFHRKSASKSRIRHEVFDLISVYLKTIDHSNLKLLIFIGILQVLRVDFQKSKIGFWAGLYGSSAHENLALITYRHMPLIKAYPVGLKVQNFV